MTSATTSRAAGSARAMILPLALAQFIASYAATNMNVAITSIAKDLGTLRVGGGGTRLSPSRRRHRRWMSRRWMGRPRRSAR